MVTLLTHPIVHTALFGINPFSWLGGHIAGLAVSGFKAIVKALFSPLAKFIDQQLVGWLVTVPHLTQGQVAGLEQTVEAMAGGLLGAVATISIARYWAAGLAGGGTSGFSALEGLGRTVGAALMLAMWPWLFDAGVRLTNLFTGALLGSGTVTHDVAHLLADGVGGGLIAQMAGFGLFVMIVVAIIGTLLFLGLLLMKLVVAVSTVLVFIGMPLAIVVWPVAPWVARAAIRAFSICLMVPVLWVLCFAGSAAVADNATLLNASGLANTLLQPLVAIMLLYVMIKLPAHLARVAMLGAAPLGGGMASRAVSYAAGAELRQSVAGALGSRRQNTGSQTGQSGAEKQTSTRVRKAATIAGAAATGGAAAPAATAAAATGGGGVSGAGGVAATASSSGGARGYSRPLSAQANAAGAVEGNGLQTPSFRQEDFDAERFEAEHRAANAPVSAERATEALASLPADTRRGVAALVSQHGDSARDHLAYQATGAWPTEQREALRDLAAATPQVRASAIAATSADSDRDAGDSAPASQDPPTPPPAGQPIAPTEPPTTPTAPADSSDVEHLSSPVGGQPSAPAPQPAPANPPQQPTTAGNGSGNGGNGDRRRAPAPRPPSTPRPHDLLD